MIQACVNATIPTRKWPRAHTIPHEHKRWQTHGQMSLGVQLDQPQRRPAARTAPARCANKTRRNSFGTSIWSDDLAAVGPWPSRATARTKPQPKARRSGPSERRHRTESPRTRYLRKAVTYENPIDPSYSRNNIGYILMRGNI